jgi:hypothetical protein
MSYTEPNISVIAGATRTDTSPQQTGIAGSKKKKLSTKARASEPAIGKGSNEILLPVEHKCEIWVSRQKAAAASISAKAVVAAITSLVD